MLQNGAIHAKVSFIPSLDVRLYTQYKGVNLLDNRVPSHSVLKLGKASGFKSNSKHAIF
jgi:hypothetical protein